MLKLDNTYLVGGAVRDTLLGQKPKDKDYVVVGESVQTMLSLGFQQVGRDFPVFLHPHTGEEYALARTERKNGPGYKGFSVNTNETVTLLADLARRDLTINAMAMRSNGEVVDPFNGRDDLARKVLRHTSMAFIEDPVRVLRIARFLARFGESWTIAGATQRLIKTLYFNGELKHLTPERVWAETEKALAEPYPHLYFKTLVGLGIFPELDDMVGLMQPVKYHPEGDVFTHSMLVLKRAADLNFDVATRFAALTHDFGKGPCYRTTGKFHGHEQVGVLQIRRFCERLRVPKRFMELALLTSDNHTRCHKVFEMRTKKIHRFMIEKMDAVRKPERFKQFVNACRCDAQGRGDAFVDADYSQQRIALTLLQALQNLDRKALVQFALSKGKQGRELGQFIKSAELTCIRHVMANAKM